jgi:hypothetical protein
LLIAGPVLNCDPVPRLDWVPCFEHGGTANSRLTVHLDRVRDSPFATPEAVAELLLSAALSRTASNDCAAAPSNSAA